MKILKIVGYTLLVAMSFIATLIISFTLFEVIVMILSYLEIPVSNDKFCIEDIINIFMRVKQV